MTVFRTMVRVVYGGAPMARALVSVVTLIGIMLMGPMGCGGDAQPSLPVEAGCPVGCDAAGFTCDRSATPPRCASEATGEVFIPAGTFFMGCSGTIDDEGERLDEPCEPDEFPQRWVMLSAYAIDRTEVTAASWDAFQLATRGQVNARDGELPTSGNPDKADHPINFVTFDEAAAYCAWPDKAAGVQRLCTEAEWEKAARGGCEVLGCGDDRTCCRERSQPYPWGASIDDIDTRAVVETQGTRAVGSRPAGASPYGLLDLAGNVEEWVADAYAGDAYCSQSPMCTESCDACRDAPIGEATDPEGPDGAWPLRILRGGGFDAGTAGGGFNGPIWPALRVSRRNAWPPEKVGSRIGFRCCRTL